MPAGVVEAAEIFIVLAPLPGDAMLDGEKLAVAPFGNPDVVNEIADLKPVPAAVVSFTCVKEPVETVALVASLATKNAGTSTTRLRVCVPI